MKALFFLRLAAKVRNRSMERFLPLSREAFFFFFLNGRARFFAVTAATATPLPHLYRTATAPPIWNHVTTKF